MRPQPAPIGKSGVTPLRTQVNYLKRKAQSSVFILWTGGILVCLLAVLLALLLSSCGSGDNVPVTTDPPVTETDPGTAQTGGTEPTDNGGETAAPSAQPSAASGSTILGETADAGQEYIDKLTFLGDSTTYGLRYYKMLSGGTDTTQVLLRNGHHPVPRSRRNGDNHPGGRAPGSARVPGDHPRRQRRQLHERGDVQGLLHQAHTEHT